MEKAIRTQFSKYFPNPDTFKKKRTKDGIADENPYRSITRWFDAGNHLNIFLETKDEDKIQLLYKVDGLFGLVKKYFPTSNANENALLMEFVLHGLATHSLISKKVLEGKIEFKNISFAYPTRKDFQVLKELNFAIEPGEKVALVGQSGSGKSTIINLLMRFYPVNQGMISVDGNSIQDFNLTAYRKNLGIVPQEVILFGGTIRENILYGKPAATVSEIRQAARQANALEFIESFPDRFETVVGERGVKLSGGQRQRIAIARAILKNPSILILDEATSSLDAHSEVLVQEALEKLMEGRTTIIIAHRLSTIKKVDRIFVIQEGRIAEVGSHLELSGMDNGIYRNLLNLQLQ